MTKRELNRDIKRLYIRYMTLLKKGSSDDFYAKRDDLKAEFLRLYWADKEGKYLNTESIKAMHRINQVSRFVALWHFYANFDPYDLSFNSL